MPWQMTTLRAKSTTTPRREGRCAMVPAEGAMAQTSPATAQARPHRSIPVFPSQGEGAKHGHQGAGPITFRTDRGIDLGKAGPERREALPHTLQTHIEQWTGTAMQDVDVHYNSREPSRFGAKAITKDDQIHLGPGEEDQLSHEAWHAAQQKQGRVRATGTINGLAVNDQPALEREADVMGARAESGGTTGLGGGDFWGEASPDGLAETSVAQLKVEHDGSAYVGTSERPGWQVHAERDMSRRYHEDRGEAYVDQTVDYKKLKLDRCHVASFDDIQTWIVNYLNNPGPAGEGRLVTNTNALLKYVVASENAKGVSARNELIVAVAGGDKDTIIAAANKLLGLMNSVSINLRAANKYLNSYIGQRLDPTFEATPGGSRVRATAHTKGIMGLGGAQVQPLMLTPEHQQRVVTSEGGIPFSDMTPTTQSMMKAHPSTTRQAKSQNVRKALYPSGGASNPYLKMPPSGSTAPSAPKPKINLTGAPVAASAPVSATGAAPSTAPATTGQAPVSGFGAPPQPTQPPPMSPFQIIQLQMSHLANQHQQALAQYNTNLAQIQYFQTLQSTPMASAQSAQISQQIQALNFHNFQLNQFMAQLFQQHQQLQSLLAPPTFSPGPT